jgi:hypothetical protein
VTRTGPHHRRWWVAAPHRVREVGGLPPGTHHARRPGELRTACGLPAAHWVLFYEFSFDARRRTACRDCALALVELSRAAVRSGARPARAEEWA